MTKKVIWQRKLYHKESNNTDKCNKLYLDEIRFVEFIILRKKICMRISTKRISCKTRKLLFNYLLKYFMGQYSTRSQIYFMRLQTYLLRSQIYYVKSQTVRCKTVINIRYVLIQYMFNSYSRCDIFWACWRLLRGTGCKDSFQ